ncbi:hypothetical protein ISN45_Aa01g039980 [Arabidopsis thaliana x Arabidopsis arenosa]|uniref:Transmembrane protein n=1 Tax=Arabidopsis thaliana x Arabidopsis arenosa TaxID=1240361 RepID=A0A8T2C7K3_9BRAS|nr:hypothetical protein ISN45_Aa01g039980 [Arabidopsis thaliana x Arabidopsis arenosa]
MCCGRICMLCTCLALVVIAIGLVFGFGVFRNGFNKIHETIHLDCDPRLGCNGVSRRSYGFVAPPNKF